jgi:hypothetical protein
MTVSNFFWVDAGVFTIKLMVFSALTADLFNLCAVDALVTKKD